MSPSASQDRLGLALAGGGFRAALFHVGVLRRLAELDLLREVQLISTVSGGSIVGAIYALRLKKWLESHHRPTRPDYIELVREVEDILCRGVGKNLRTRLLLNPLTTLRVLCTPDSLGRAMARLHERHFLREALYLPHGYRRLKERPRVVVPRRQLQRDLQLAKLRIDVPGVGDDVAAYNRVRREAQWQTLEATGGGPTEPPTGEEEAVATALVVNATCLNSGGRFFFSAAEVGDYYLGAFRADEAEDLVARRPFLFGDLDELKQELTQKHNLRQAMAVWWRTRADRDPFSLGAYFPTLFPAAPTSDHTFPGDLADAALGMLRQAKIEAWYYRKGDGKGYDPEPIVHLERFKRAVRDIDRRVADTLERHADPAALREACEFVLELYYTRTAQHISKWFLQERRFWQSDWQRLTVGDAVGASACFPPVFPPFLLLGIYDDATVTRLGLTDGGVYDNTGVTALLDERCTSIIASDTGGVFQQQSAAAAGRIGLMARTPDILMRALGGCQRLALRDRKRYEGNLNELAYFKIDTAPPIPRAQPAPLELGRYGIQRRQVAELRTDLDGFGGIEIAALVNDGYDTADRFVRRFMEARAKPWWPKAPPVLPRAMDADPDALRRVEKVIAAGRARFGRALKVGAWQTVAALILVAAGLVWAAVSKLGLGDVVQAARKVRGWLGAALAPLPEPIRKIPLVLEDVVWPWLREVLPKPWMPLILIGAIVLLLLLKLAARAAGAELRRRGLYPTWLLTTWKWIVSLRGNLLWFAWALPLLIALALVFVAAISWGVFFIPWSRKAALPPEEREGAGRPESAAPAEAERRELQHA